MLKPFYDKNKIEAGCDEVGRGCLAGPVVASAVILPKDFYHPDLNDSKKLSEKKRNELRKIIECKAISYGVSFINNEKIDEINILQASFLAMHQALDGLNHQFDLILVDGNKFKPYKGHGHVCIVKGDSKFAPIAAASILAKTYRDEYMIELAQSYPHYGWEKNVGYPTKVHREGIKQRGISPYHRKSFNLLPNQLNLFENL